MSDDSLVKRASVADLARAFQESTDGLFGTRLNMAKRTRLDVLQASLKKKQAKVDGAFDAHFADAKSANGQPLNDKSNGAATLDRWERQGNAIRNAQSEVERTKLAIEREVEKEGGVELVNERLPQYVLDMVAAGELSQWRRHPTTFFVPGVDKGRIVVDLDTGGIIVRHMQDIPKTQFPKFRDTANKMILAYKVLKGDVVT